VATGTPRIQPDAGPGARAVYTAAIGLVGLGALLHGANRYRDFYSDDSLISLRYAERLLAGRGLTWNDGEYVEGYSNLLWVLASSLLGFFGVDLQDATRILGVLGTGAAIAAVVWLHRPARLGDGLPALAGGLAMALTGTFAIWTVGGLEQPMLVGLLAWALVLLTHTIESHPSGSAAALPPRALLPAGVLLGFVCLTRPDGPIFVACGCVSLLWLGRLRASAWRNGLWLALPGVVLIALQLGFRLWYYDAWVPNTAHSKLTLSGHRLEQGFAYWWQGVRPLLAIALPAALTIALASRFRELRTRVAIWLPPLIAWSVWVVVIGGDIFPGRRHLITIVLGFAVLSAELWRFGSMRLRGWARVVVVVAALTSIVLLAHAQRTGDRAHARALLEVPWARGGEALGRLLGETFADDQPLLAVTAAGSLPYYSKLPALDMLGLNDRHLAMNPPPDLGRGRIGHELGDGAYFLARAPDIVVFCGTTGAARACSRGGREMQRSAEFGRSYTSVSLLTEAPVVREARLFMRSQGEKVGVRAEQGGRRIVVPGYLFSSFEGDSATLDDAGRLGVLIGASSDARFANVKLPAGQWTVRSEGRGEVRVTPYIAGAPAGSSGVLQIAGNGPATIELGLTTRDEGAHVLRVVLERVP
jgi:arabinofuranosyltransferase